LRRSLFAVIGALALVAALAAPVAADYGDPTQQGPLHPMTFPVVGPVSYTDTFGAPRAGGRTHQGQDLMGTKMQPEVAAADGVVSFITIPQASWGYGLTVTGDDGWSYHYLHVNNDTPGTDDGQAPAQYVFAPGIAKGVRVSAGQLVAYMGDSGDAENTGPHLHFELHDPSDTPVNAFASLNAAPRLDTPIAPPAPFPRVAGPDRVATAVDASRAGWPDGAANVVVAAGDRYAEALPASVLAAKQGGPLLLTTGPTLVDTVRAELTRLHATQATVIGSVPVAVDTDLRSMGIGVVRVGSADAAVTTAAAVAKLVGAPDHVAVLVNQSRFPDGVSAAGLAAGRGWPILLSSTTSVPQRTVDTWRALGVTKTYLVGGTVVLSDGVAGLVPGASRLAGADRYATSVAVAQESLRLGGRSADATDLATGSTYPDALAAGSYAARTGGLVVLVDGSGHFADGASRDFLALTGTAPGVDVRAVLGGTNAVSETAYWTLAAMLGRSAGPPS
jgi:putative cell wall-binding protein